MSLPIYSNSRSKNWRSNSKKINQRLTNNWKKTEVWEHRVNKRFCYCENEKKNKRGSKNGDENKLLQRQHFVVFFERIDNVIDMYDDENKCIESVFQQRLMLRGVWHTSKNGYELLHNQYRILEDQCFLSEEK